MQLDGGHGSEAGNANRMLAVLAMVHIAIHLVTNGRYGIFRDELYYVACSDHLAWGYVDHPPLSIFILSLTRWLTGDSVEAIRLPVALAGGVAVFLTGRLAGALGGSRTAQWMAALAYVVTATSLVLFGFFSMNAFDLLFWIIGAHIAVRLIDRGDGLWWVALGMVLGLGLLNKYSVGFFAFGLVAGLALTPQRRLLRGLWPWVGGVIALVSFAPHLVWQVSHGLPTLEFIRNAQEHKIVAMSPLQFIGAQILQNNPLVAPFWMLGLGYLLLGLAMRRYRALGWAYFVLLAVFILQNGKPYYLSPIYPVLLAAGGVALERAAASARAVKPVVARRKKSAFPSTVTRSLSATR